MGGRLLSRSCKSRNSSYAALDIGIPKQSNRLSNNPIDLIKLLKEYVDCFAWNYNEMPGLSRDLVERRLPIKPGFRPYK
jgi:hypothetical protein